MSKTIKIKDERETQKQKQKTNKQTKKQNKVDGSYSERVRDKWFCWAFKFSPTNM